MDAASKPLSAFDKFLNDAVKLHKEGKYAEAINIYNGLLGRDLKNHLILYLIGDAFLRQEMPAISAQFFSMCLQYKPDFQDAWQDLGVALKKEHYNVEALDAWNEALKYGEKAEIYINMASLYSDHGLPEKGLMYSNKAIELGNDGPECHWNKALALLSMQQWAEGWKEHESRRKLDSYHERTKLELPDYDGTQRRVIVTGEQGVGDEIMYISCLDDLKARTDRIVVECEERLVPVLKRHGIEAYRSQDEILEKVDIKRFDARIPLGSLPSLFRNDDSQFPRKSYLTADPELVAEYRHHLEKLGHGPYIGLSWTGGTKPTRIQERSIPVNKMRRFKDFGTCISLQYGDFGPIDSEAIGIAHWPGVSSGTDLEKTLALIEALDMVITVTTSVVHFAGALGKKTIIMAPSNPSWRYNLNNGEYLPWYSDSKIVRQQDDEKWESVIERVMQECTG